MPATYLSPYVPTAATLTRTSQPGSSCFVGYSSPRKSCFSRGCRASSSSSTSSITDFDLYDLLGIDSSSTQNQIKFAYRSLQKRCHPDIAGPSGHDMSIILNEAYALLSDPNLRSAYDKEQAKVSELRGFTGRPLYSAWFGSENEHRAVFVDEVKCVGCLKCALFAGKTFAIESVYGRARAVAQWADPEHKIQEAIDSCPVDCISMVERSDLAALEFLMSKQPRGNVRVGAGNAAGARVSNIFVEVKKFQTKVKDVADRANSQNSETDLQREARIAAVNAIRSLSNWLHWQSPVVLSQDLARTYRKPGDPTIKKLRDAAAARKRASIGTRHTHQITVNSSAHNEYWTPSKPDSVFPSSPGQTSIPKADSKPLSPKEERNDRGGYGYRREREVAPGGPISLAIPMVMAAIAAAVVRLNYTGGAVRRVEDHIAGSLAVQIVNSSWLQIILAGATWFVMGMAVVELIGVIGDKRE